MMYRNFLFLYLFLKGLDALPCKPRQYDYTSFVCVCDSTYCDTLDPVAIPPLKSAYLFETSKAKSRFSKSVVNFKPSPSPGAVIAKIDRNTKYQFIVGFGGAFTDASGINIGKLPLPLQQQVINAYYGKNGLQYTMGRVPMASCDFSTCMYSYDDVRDDFNLTHFELANADLRYKIPYIQKAMALTQNKLLLFGSPWSAPAWMKTNGNMTGPGTLIGDPGDKLHKTWANYFVKFLQAYESYGLKFWGLTVQNEPTAGFLPSKLSEFQVMGFTPEMARDFIKLDLGPALQKAGYGIDKLKLMIMDDQRLMMPHWAHVVLGDPDAAKYVSGIAFHWYFNSFSPPCLLKETHEKYPNVFILPTEACSTVLIAGDKAVHLGSWERAEDYGHDIIQDLLNWSSGWIDWNLALDTEGGPNWVKNFVDSAIIVNASAKEFYKQPIYYTLAHFSKLLPPGSRPIGLELYNETSTEIDTIAFVTPENAIVVTILNRGNNPFTLSVYDKLVGYLNVVVPSHSIQSYIWSG